LSQLNEITNRTVAGKQALRKRLRRQRKLLDDQQRQTARRGLLQQAKKYAPLWRAKRLASFSAMPGELEPWPIEQALDAELYHPRITNTRLGRMHFFPLARSGVSKNAFGITEPNPTRCQIDPRHLDAVLVPLVAFQRDGSRLGQGGGFYDRAFAFRKQWNRLSRPLLIGIAHHFQETSCLSSEPWDVPLDAIITDRELIVI
jgi:5-formyltetrahydrofolate cyclo-ligase